MKPPSGVLAAWVCGLLLSACAFSGAVPEIAPGERPAVNSDEGGLWLEMELAEEELRTSGYRLEDAELEAYLHSILCRLSADYCKDIRIYVLRVPAFNAMMTPNGAMVVFTGLLLRAQNEAQIATVIGHELAHYVHRHSLLKYRDYRNKADALAVLQLVIAAATLPPPGIMIGPVASAVTLETILAYSRETEREADAMGRDYLAKAGYDPREAVVIWQLLLEESEALPKEERPVFLATHPAIRERIANLEEANANSSIDPTTLESGRGRYDAVVQSYRALWIQDEFRKRKLAQSEVIMKHLLKADPSSGELQFYQGEIYRLRNGKEDRALAIDYYRHALSFRDAPPEAYRSLGLVLWDQDDTVAAGAAFEAYLENKPTADDRLMIESYIEDLKKKNVL